MAYNRWLAHHGVKGQKWGERNGPPYPLDSSISTGSKLIKADGSPQGKKKYKTSEKTAHKRAERKARTEASEDERDYKRLQNFFDRHVGWDKIDAIDHDGRINIELEDLAHLVVDGKISKKEYNKRASVIRDEIRKRIDEEARNGSEWAPDTQKHLAKVDKYHRAADDDVYDLDFLEEVQNEKWYNNKKRMLKEYSDYLKDSDKFSQKRFSDEEKIASAKLEAERMLPHDNSLSAKIRKKSLFNSDGTLNAKGRKYYHVSGDGTLSFDELELRQKSTEERPYMKSFKEYITKKEGLDTTGLSKKTKAAKEKELLRLWYKDRTTNREDAIQDTLHARIADKSGSWYFGESVTEKFQKALMQERAAHKAFMNSGRNEKTVSDLAIARRKLCKAVLMDLGYEVNAENIQLIEGWIIDD